MSQLTTPTPTEGINPRRRPRPLPFTQKQKKKIQIYKTLIAIEIVAIVVLVVLRWFVGGWWIDWESGRDKSSAQDQDKQNVSTQETVYGDFNAPAFEPNAVTGTPTVDDSLGWAVLEISEGYTVHVCGILNADSTGRLPVWFHAEADNKVWVKLRVLDGDGEVLGETGILKPGEYVEAIQLIEGAHSCAVTLQIMGYEPETYYSAGSVGLATNLAVAE